jgi:septal ring factor EnvC (AmiA/AmiB activator)
MHTRLITALGFAVLAAALPLCATDRILETRNALDKWVQARQIISEEQSDWKLEQSILRDTESLLINELARLNQALDDLEASATAADEDRTRLAAEKEVLVAASSVVESEIGVLETQLKATVKILPEPLVEKIKPLIRRLPDDPAMTKLSLGERVQNIVGILSQADKFNTTITQTSESLEIGDGRMVEVRTLYWGLGMAYYVDASGEYAGIGIPAEEGWEWPQLDGSGAQIKRLLDVYEGSEDIQFVEVPAQIN